MNLLKTKFYPVDMKNGTIYIDPMARERDIANKWGRGEQPCIGLRGSRLVANKCYEAFLRVPTVTKATVLADWKEEAGRSLYLWESAARRIVATIEGNEPEQALGMLKDQLKNARRMAISASYYRAVNDMKTVINQQAQAAA